MRKFFVGLFLIIIFLGILAFFLFEKEIKIVSKIKPSKVFQEFIEKTEREIKEKKESTSSQSTINPQEFLEGIVKKSENELTNEKNSKSFSFVCEKIKKREEVLIKFKEFFLKLEIELEVKKEEKEKCLTLISINRLIEVKIEKENLKKEDFEFLKSFLEGKKFEVSISKQFLFEILKKIENKEVFIF